MRRTGHSSTVYTDTEGPSRKQARQPRILPSGDTAVLLDCGDLENSLHVFRVLGAARDAGELVVDELVPAAQTVLVRGGDARDQGGLTSRVLELLTRSDSTAEVEDPAFEIEIPVTYDGEDLADVAAITGLSVDEVIKRHTETDYTVAFCGFAPGFAYLAGGDPALQVPRRATPRHRVPTGAVGLAAQFSAVYPRASPGGWQLIGHTREVMWDLNRSWPALLTPATKVRFVRDDGRAVGVPHGSSPKGELDSAGTSVLSVSDPGLQTLLQDGGRPGLASMGVSASGAVDRQAHARANRLVGNPETDTAVELGHGGFVAEVLSTTVLAVSGALRQGCVTGPYGRRSVPQDRPFRVDVGERLECGPPEHGLRTTLAVRGGIVSPATLGSTSRDTLAGLGPEPLGTGSVVRAGVTRRPVGLPEPVPGALPAPGDEVELEVLPGPRDEWFGREGVRELCDVVWEVTPRSDRVGVRLDGAPIARLPEFVRGELPSEGLITGSIQVPPDGQPVLFLADHPLTGGYPVIGVVRERDVPLAAQLSPGVRVRFRQAKPSPNPSPASDHVAPSATPRSKEEDSR